ncbi:hypothetical protein QOZ80_5BG0449160 [Eleusine coracana subsp. coracana]|nr:hypothetical protein QOZ80_5BG0449160 [Eleusine coracana subsp. coracana]
MRKVCPNLDREDGGLDTVLEVPLPELNNNDASSGRVSRRRRRTVKAWVRSHMEQRHRRDGATPSRADVQLMLGVIGAPLVLQPVEARKAMAGQDIKEEPLEVSKARYIVEQYVAAAGGEAALNAAKSMYAMGNVRMRTTKGQKAKTGMGVVGGGGEVAGGFVLWQKRQPEQWCVEMVVAGGTKMSAGSDGKVAWRQSPWQQAHASRGPPRPLRRCVQGLDPKSTADLFATAAWVGEKHIDATTASCSAWTPTRRPSAPGAAPTSRWSGTPCGATSPKGQGCWSASRTATCSASACTAARPPPPTGRPPWSPPSATTAPSTASKSRTPAAPRSRSPGSAALRRPPRMMLTTKPAGRGRARVWRRRGASRRWTSTSWGCPTNASCRRVT